MWDNVTLFECASFSMFHPLTLSRGSRTTAKAQDNTPTISGSVRRRSRNGPVLAEGQAKAVQVRLVRSQAD